MIRNYFKIAWRNLFRQRTYSLFNLLGLSLGISCALLLTLHIKQELSYEKSFPNHKLIYRCVSTEWSKSSPPLAGELVKHFPEIERVTRLAEYGEPVVNYGPEKKGISKGYFADSTIIDMFSLKPILGDPRKALSEPFAIVITRSMAEKYFGKEDPIGKKLLFQNREEAWVKGVIEDLPKNSHLQFDFLGSMNTFYKYVPENWTSNRGWMFGWTYVQFKSEADYESAKKKMKNFWVNYRNDFPTAKEREEEANTHRLQPLTDIHLKSDLIQEMGPNSNIIYIYIFIAVEVLILLIACVNFINLFTTQALKRLKEVAVRKVLGAQKSQLIIQFLGEAFLLTLMAGLVAVIIYETVIPFYNSITGKEVSRLEILSPGNIYILIGIVLCTGILSGLFPALFISGFQPAETLKSSKVPRSSASILRKGLVVFQFVVAGFLIISTILIYQQMKLFRTKQLGFDKEQVMILNLYGGLQEEFLSHPEVIKNEILSNPDVISVGRSSNIIGDDLSVEQVIPVNAPAGKQYPTVRVYRIDDNYLNVLGIKLKEGRNFSKEFNDSAAFILNERAVHDLEIKDPLQTEVENSTNNLRGKIVGVVKDFHFNSLHSQIEPLVLEYKPKWAGNLFIKIRAGKTPETIDFLKKKVEAIAPGTLFKYGFLDDKISGLYQKEDNMSQILKLFCGLSIVISCLGLFGLAAHASEIRTKEIGIRKVIGAGTGNLLRLLSKDFVILVLLGNLIAWPLAWYVVSKWLQEFTYKVNISWWVFAFSLISTVLIALLTISYHCIKTARANPVQALKTE
ncbi:MAG: ABC transporter permease [Bacteroidetes bacterium]|nr:MAG: ABC transporter permease [Bacteroidota bacterium]